MKAHHWLIAFFFIAPCPTWSACREIELHGFYRQSPVNGASTFVNTSKSAVLADRCAPMAVSRAEAVLEFSKAAALAGSNVNKINDDLYFSEREIAGIKFISYLRIGKSFRNLTLLIRDSGQNLNQIHNSVLDRLAGNIQDNN